MILPSTIALGYNGSTWKKSVWQGLLEIGADIANEVIGKIFWPYGVGSSLYTAYNDLVDQQQSAYREYMENGWQWKE